MKDLITYCFMLAKNKQRHGRELHADELCLHDLTIHGAARRCSDAGGLWHRDYLSCKEYPLRSRGCSFFKIFFIIVIIFFP